jgi:hypothetical protein
MTTIKTTPKITLPIPGCFGSRFTAGRWSIQPATVAAWFCRK